MRKSGNVLIGLTMVAMVAGAVAVVYAADDPVAVIKQRQAAMKQNGADMKAINAGLESGSPDMADIAKRAEEINATAKKIPDLFPKGTGIDDNVAKTEAKMDIWQDPDGFKAAAARLEQESAKLAQLAQAGDRDAVGDQFATLGKEGCGGCHTKFRQKTQ